MLRRWATASRKLRVEAMVVVVVVLLLSLEGLLLVDVKGRDGVVVGVTTGEVENGMAAVLAREAVNGLLYTRRRRPLSKVGSSGADIAMARTRRAGRSVVLARIICCQPWKMA